MTKEEIFEEIKGKHPGWTDDQVWTQVGVRIKGEDIISRAPDNMTTNDSEIVRAILRAADEWLRQWLPVVWERVQEWLRGLIERVSEWFRDYGWEFLVNLFNPAY